MDEMIVDLLNRFGWRIGQSNIYSLGTLLDPLKVDAYLNKCRQVCDMSYDIKVISPDTLFVLVDFDYTEQWNRLHDRVGSLLEYHHVKNFNLNTLPPGVPTAINSEAEKILPEFLRYGVNHDHK